MASRWATGSISIPRTTAAPAVVQRGEEMACDAFTLNGYFGVTPLARDVPRLSLWRLCRIHGDLATAWCAWPRGWTSPSLPAGAIFGTSYGALQRARLGPVDTLLVNGASGTLGLGAVLFGLAMTAGPILATGRDLTLLDRVKAIAPDRIEVFSTSGQTKLEGLGPFRTGGHGAEVVIDTLPPGAPISAFEAGIDALAKFGRHVNCGGIIERASFNTPRVMVASRTLLGSMWFTTAQACEMMELVRLGRIDLGLFEHERFALEDIELALERIDSRRGGFSNLVIEPKFAVVN